MNHNKTRMLLLGIVCYSLLSPLYFSGSAITWIISDEVPPAAPVTLQFSTPLPEVLVYVNSTLVSGLTSCLSQYVSDGAVTGYNVTVISWANINATQLRGNLTTRYNTIGSRLKGALLVGILPFVLYESNLTNFQTYPDVAWEAFPCDLYFMDLDGIWADLDSNGTLDDHSGNVAPEIWVSRIDPRAITGSNHVSLIQTYFDRVHAYKNGSITRPHSALTYVDDDWIPWATTYASNMSLAYPNTTTISTGTTTTSADYRSRYTQQYEWVALFVHSWPNQHVFGPGGWGAEGTVSHTDIRSDQNNALFYALFCCHGSLFTSQNCLASEYLFDSALATIGTTKTGGLQWEYNLYYPLSQNLSLGDSFRQWFQNVGVGYESTIYEGYGEAWYYGMVIFGDPLLTIHHDITADTPQLSCLSHPDPNIYYANTTVTINWTAPQDLSGIQGYYWVIDQTPTTIPTRTTSHMTTHTVQVNSSLGDGTWWFHLRAEDNASNLGLTSHIAFQIDTTRPSLAITQPNNHSVLDTNSCTILWTATDSGGIQEFRIYLNGALVYTGISSSYTCTLLSGNHTFRIEVIDTAGNQNSSLLFIQVDIPETGTGNTDLDRFLAFLQSPLGLSMMAGLGLFSLYWLMIHRRRSKSSSSLPRPSKKKTKKKGKSS